MSVSQLAWHTLTGWRRPHVGTSLLSNALMARTTVASSSLIDAVFDSGTLFICGVFDHFGSPVLVILGGWAPILASVKLMHPPWFIPSPDLPERHRGCHGPSGAGAGSAWVGVNVVSHPGSGRIGPFGAIAVALVLSAAVSARYRLLCLWFY